MWMRSTTFILFFVALSTMAALHNLALMFYLYWTYLWIDIPMHILGGAVVALGFLAFFRSYVRVPLKIGLPLTLLVVLAVGIGWELFEWFGGLMVTERAIVADTSLDLVCDLVGGALGYWLARLSTELDG